MPTNNAAAPIRHIFVLMLENRSFDHMLGFSGITGQDAVSGQPTKVEGLTGQEFNDDAQSGQYKVTSPANCTMPMDPAHEFEDVVEQLCGSSASYNSSRPYPPINCSGFVTNYATHGGKGGLGEIMKCYNPAQIPVLVALAKEFAICDHWHASMPGPTWPNRFFLHAASSGGLDHSPTISEIGIWETLSGFHFERGTIFDALNALDNHNGWRIYAGGDFPNVAALKGINNFEIKDLDDFASDVALPDYGPRYSFIEPNYGDVVLGTFQGGNSQHPLDDITHGEALIKSVYEAIRRSPLWPESLLIVTWDEHGGFYDHVPPPPAISPGDRPVTDGANQYEFDFAQYGPRVPAVVISPLIPKNLIDHRLYDHASVPATIEALFGLKPLTQRDTFANNVTSLASLVVPRTDAPMTLPSTAVVPAVAMTLLAPPTAKPTDPVDAGNLPGFLHAALRSDLALSNPDEHAAILARFKQIKTRADGQQYMDQVRMKVRAGRFAIRQKGNRLSRR